MIIMTLRSFTAVTSSRVSPKQLRLMSEIGLLISWHLLTTTNKKLNVSNHCMNHPLVKSDLLREVAFYVSFNFNLFSTWPVSLSTPTCIQLHCISKNVVGRKVKSLSQDREVKWDSYNDLL